MSLGIRLQGGEGEGEGRREEGRGRWSRPCTGQTGMLHTDSYFANSEHIEFTHAEGGSGGSAGRRECREEGGREGGREWREGVSGLLTVGQLAVFGCLLQPHQSQTESPRCAHRGPTGSPVQAKRRRVEGEKQVDTCQR